MTAQQIMGTINKLTAKRNRQATQLELTEKELEHWESQLKNLKTGK